RHTRSKRDWSSDVCSSDLMTRANARVIAAIEPVDRSFDVRHGVLVRRAAVKDERGGEVRAIGGKAERLAATPAKAGNKQFAAREIGRASCRERVWSAEGGG